MGLRSGCWGEGAGLVHPFSSYAATAASHEAAADWLNRHPDWPSVREAYLRDRDITADPDVEKVNAGRRLLGSTDVSTRSEVASISLLVARSDERVAFDRFWDDAVEIYSIPCPDQEENTHGVRVWILVPSRDVGRTIAKLSDRTLTVRDPLVRLSLKAPPDTNILGLPTSLLTWCLATTGVEGVWFRGKQEHLRFVVPAHQSPLACQVVSHLTTPLPP